MPRLRVETQFFSLVGLFGIAEIVGQQSSRSVSESVAGGGFVIACSWKASVWEEYWRNAYFLRTSKDEFVFEE